MNDLKDQLINLKTRFDQAVALVKIDSKKQEIEKLSQEMNKSDFWSDQNRARKISQIVSSLQQEIDTWDNFGKELIDSLEMLEFDIDDKDVNLRPEFEVNVANLEEKFSHLELNLLLEGDYDSNSAILTINAGSGGTDAQDWAEMLLRMYLRFAEKQNWQTEILNISSGAEAGIKSVQVEISGRYAYGYLKSESGVHRLVRISPFDAEKMRHTSFAMVEVLPLLDSEVEVEIKDDDLRIDTYRAGGHGGQSVNTTDSAVRITHIPTNIVVQCQNERSQTQNREKALKILYSKLQQYYETEIEEERQKLRGEFTEAAWGNQARSYVLHPYKLVKDHRTKFETDKVDIVLDGDIMQFIEAYLRYQKSLDKKD
ncbi:peptide chain release factor 2 [Candidatus Falkowbacteria bacterium RIFOXYD2_FULL_35_9]|uniref:Peptide chain release factor 2 n=1 Tax=Candidatus Falkowbacteria bacterium RIFOXYC2_FULL_36_12 TaxID=1798002 RepID=A0A1F5SZI2_9BACT|nr:MAG: peptide chain release factor 2 [Candidatus Falkowbacteria bacterium RIFOXYB2_FULL_35_7]OGF31863.1 MAG: peptide chain release factor 2 [Candidatus Falkowbacteria bacterium RIFOXYC2_FULL_36_12]OGF33878.1 MAG: peptide chain release factor 2 [Candidatus Falkowbacteria bacterium RIFOXYA2_FULL_35_8]OGF45832.1 MAG: peptide chain release factor 2 [Candidatus Falkowbacteria bacterium RIFOXYD2_FULL_35_9]